ncbi:MAG: leucine-rich repeat protein [Ruminococcus sp.]|nr:leucine-rich repeat protein [Ruminococcus sp.]
MALIQAKCTSCGEVLTVDSDVKSWKCRYCGASFLTDDGLHRYNGTEGSFVIQNGTLISYTGSSAEVNIPDSVRFIGERAFENRTDITYVYFPDSVTRIGAYAFLGCTGLTRVDIPRLGLSGDRPKQNFLTGINSLDGLIDRVLSRVNQALDVEKGLSMGKYAFGGCTGLSALELNVGTEGVRDKTIGIAPTAFSGCSSLSSISLGRSITKLPDGIFDSCTDSVVIDWIALSLFPNCSSVVKRRREKGRCLSCGGSFKGLFTRKCRECGRIKRY